jgi:hypothetical protein
MRIPKGVTLAALGMALIARATFCAPVFVDPYTSPNTYTSAEPSGAYTVTDEDANYPGTWSTSGNGLLTYSRPGSNNGFSGSYVYRSSVLLTNGSTPETGSTAGLTNFTVSGTLYNNIAEDNNGQSGLVVSGSPGAGGYLLEIDNAQGNAFALLAETGNELTSDEGTPQPVIQPSPGVNALGSPAIPGHEYGVSVTVDRSGLIQNTPVFTVSITDLTNLTTVYSGTFADSLGNPLSFGGTQIGYRVRDPFDDPADNEIPTFGPLSLSVPEPSFLGLFGLGAIFLLRHRNSGRGHSTRQQTIGSRS